ncbi:MAG: hypothetical protein WCQ72_07455, partial [Eubacteriales bacterium]
MKNIKTAAAMLLCAALLVPTLGSCAKSSVAMQYGDAVITDRMYSYWFKQYQDYFLSTVNGAEDTSEFWGSELEDGTTMGQYLADTVNENVKKNLVCMKLFDDFGLKLSDAAVESVDSDLGDLVESYGSRAALNADLADYEINDTILRQIYIIQEEISALYDYMYGDEGLFLPSDEQLDEYYRANYARIKYIVLPLYNETAGEDGTAVKSEMTAEQLEAAYALSDELKARLDGGEDIDALIAQYSYDDMTSYPNGVYFSNANSGYDVIDQALAMQTGELKVIDEDTAVYIVKRLELEDKPYTDDSAGQFSDLVDNCSDWVFQNMLTGYF